MADFYGKTISHIVLKICDTNGKNIAVFYSSTKDDKKGERVAINGLRRRILKEKYQGKISYGAASIYKNKTVTGSDDLLARFNSNGELIDSNY